MKAGALLINSYLPEDLRDYSKTYDVKDMNRIMHAVAMKYPEKYTEIVKKIADTGRTASYYQGETITLADLEPVVDKKNIFAKMDAEIKALPKDDNFVKARREIFSKYTNIIERQTSENALKNRNNIAMSVMSGARGKTSQMRAMISPVGTYSDYKGVPIDVYSKESFAEGIRPATFLASTFGARASVISTKVSTAKGGDLAKQFASTAADLVIQKDDCGAETGMAFSIDDPSLKGRVLAKDVGNFKAGTFITREMLASLQRDGKQKIIARSPITCNCTSGICAKCVGKLYKGGKLPKIGDSIGLSASSTSMEPVTQMALCLAEGTLVRMGDRSKKTIESIKVGEIVSASTAAGEKIKAKVVRTYKQGTKAVRIFTLKDRENSSMKVLKVCCTDDHKFLAYDEVEDCMIIAPISLCKLYEYPIAYYHAQELRWADITKSSSRTYVNCYDIEIATEDHLFVLANGMVTSNSAKHTAGMTKDKRSYSGLEVIQQFSQSPEKFKDRGVVSELDGQVEDIHEAPQGGHFVTIAGKKHYIPAGHDVEVKVGQTIEAGDQLAEGLVDAEDIIRLKGLGEGRKYYAERLNKILEDSGAKTDKRNTEILARAAIRHVRITNNDGLGDYLPDDIVDYNALQASYVPDSSQKLRLKDTVGKYLAKPILHYTVGTRITPNVAKNLQDNEYDELEVMDSAPEFEPEMVRLRASSHTNPDWLASMGTSYLTKQLNEASTRGDDTNIKENIDYRPRLMFGDGFGKNTEQTGLF